MIVDAIASGSKGNAYYISDGTTNLLIECGVTMKRLRGHPSFEFDNLDGILISHKHGDHAKSIERCKDAGVDIYAPAEVFAERELVAENCHSLLPFQGVQIGTFFVLPFDLNHDCVNYGYLLCSKTGERLLYFTDTYMVKYKFSHLTHIMAECNYSKRMIAENVKTGLTPAWLKDRIRVSHMSLEHLLEFFKANDLSEVQHIYLMHISENNGSPAVFKHRIKKATGKKTDVLI